MAGVGYCAIKEEYVVKKLPTKILDLESHVTKENDQSNNDNKKADLELEEPPLKKIKVEETNNESKDKKDKKKNRGQNKGRPKPLRESMDCRPCPSIVNVHPGDVPNACKFNSCSFIHDPKAYLKIKSEDIDKDTCYIYETRGECPWGISCRYGSIHITPDGHNLLKEDRLEKWTNPTLNAINFETLFKLQKKKYNFKDAEDLVNKVNKKTKKNPDNKKSGENSADNEIIANNNKESNNSGTVTDEDIIKTRDIEKTKIDWNDKLYLGPLTTLGNLPFRRICKEYGADITCGEMVMCDSLLKGAKQEWALVKRHVSEDLFGVQICGSNPYVIAKVADILNREQDIKVDFVDLNLGCPIDLVYRRGGGCGMLLRTNVLETSVKCASRMLSVPFTIKTRTGVHQESKIAHNFVPNFFKWGASLLTVHGRSREQRYTKFSDWDYINECARLAKPNPVFGNGDILSYDDYIRSRERAPNVSGVMICRGGLIKPWIFTEIKEKKLWDISSSERFDILKKYTNYGLEHWGSDSRGVENTRRFLLEWCSFLYRYVPVGLLEKPPQRINERPPYYIGRNDLETLMGSPNCSDWIKISEMLLGPVPEGFQFLPKHKANSY